ncbi:MAG: hypothetical protein KC589_07220 [Nanoarchaeota archaeon]|nr:hypothetical protein [Nanoarchaeota archaeon]
MNNEINNDEIYDDELNDVDTGDSDYFESENDQDDLNDIDDETTEDTDEDDFVNSQDDNEEEDNEYDGYSIGYFTVNDDKEVVESDEPQLIKLMEEYEGGPDEYSIYDNMLDDINSDGYDDGENEEDENEEEMYDDPDFKNAIYINSELNEFNESFTSVKNPYFALNALRDFLFNFNLILPHFDLPSNYDEWVFDVSLENKSDFIKSKYICHIEILCGETDDYYSVIAGVYPK